MVDALSGPPGEKDTNNLYPFTFNDPGEDTQACKYIIIAVDNIPEHPQNTWAPWQMLYI